MATSPINADIAAIDRLIADYSTVVDGLKQARDILSRNLPPASQPAQKLLAAPVHKALPPARKAAKPEPIIHEIEGVDVAVTKLQSAILDALSAAEDSVAYAEMASKTGSTLGSVKQTVRDLRQRLKKAGCPAEINRHNGGWRFEVERADTA